MPCGDSRTVQIPVNEAVAGSSVALAREGSGILTEIDVQTVVAARPGDEAAAQVGDHLIPGACNPPQARRPIVLQLGTGPGMAGIADGSRPGLRDAPASITADVQR